MKTASFFFTCLFLLIYCFPSAGQQTITGKVLSTGDQTGIPFVSIGIKHTATGAVSDVNGAFQLTVKNTDTLIFVMIGMQTLEVPVMDKKSWVLVMAPLQMVVAESAVLGSGSAKRADVSGFSSSAATEVYSKRAAPLEGRSTGERIREAGSVRAYESMTAPEAVYDLDRVAEIAVLETDAHAVGVPVGTGVLTAGSIHDFSKWNLWQDKTAEQLKEHRKVWQMNPEKRYTVQVVNPANRPVIDCEVELLSEHNEVLWRSRTDNTGKAELWASMFDGVKQKPARIRINHPGMTVVKDEITAFHQGINMVKLPVNCHVPDRIDIQFVVDATGSMGDEIQYLKEELKDIIGKVKQKESQSEIRLGSVFFRDHGDAYVTRKSPFSTDVSVTTGFIENQYAGGGGDTPEAVDDALHVALHEFDWSSDAKARLLFLLLDAPPHQQQEVVIRMQSLLLTASIKGVRIIPVVASGSGYAVDKSLEYLMRSAALATNGHYVFLTDHSGVGGKHTKPTTDAYDVNRLNDLLVKLISDYVYAPGCEEDLPSFEHNRDTILVPNPKRIDHVIIDSALVVLLSNDTATVQDDSRDQDAVQHTDVTNGDLLWTQFKYYPNPTQGALFVEIEGRIEVLFLADVTGKLIQRHEVNNQARLTIHLEPFPKGVYFLQYFDQEKEKWISGKVVRS